MKIKRNMIVWAELKSGLRHIQAGRRPCIVISCDKANGKSPVYTVIPGTTKMRKNYIPVHFNIEPSEIRGFLRHTTMFLPEQLVTINEEQIIQTAGVVFVFAFVLLFMLALGLRFGLRGHGLFRFGCGRSTGEA